jgi:4-hydroxybenzoate polyprenyltransferase
MVEIVPDTQHRGLVAALPQSLRDLVQLARLDRPIGIWLLFWPCAWGVLLAGGEGQWGLLGWLLLGAIAMRSAGCVYNDLVDADLDRQVARTAARPVASGRIGKTLASAWLLGLCLVGLAVLLQLRWQAQLIALASLAPVAAYPFMKRITWWPQAWLGIVFSWGALVGWTELRPGPFDMRLDVLALLYAGSIAWVIGYDTIYALQDREDDALVGIRSSARRMGSRVQSGVALFYAAALACWALAFWRLRPDALALLALAPIALHLAWQITTLKPDDADSALTRFRANRFAGLLLALACWVVGNA